MIPNSELENRLKALRACGSKVVDMGIAMRMVTLQRAISERRQIVQTVLNGLIERHDGSSNGGPPEVVPGTPGWAPFVKEHNELMAEEFDAGPPFVLYEKDGKYGWTEGVEAPVTIAPNVMVDMDDLLEIRAPKEKEDATVAGNIG